MAKSYLRYEQHDSFGVIASSSGDVMYVPGTDGRIAITTTLETITIWNVKQGIIVGVLKDEGNTSAVTSLALDPSLSSLQNGCVLAAGYEDGKIRVWNITKKEVIVVLNAHASSVTALAYNPNGSMLASGSRDTEIVLWDIVAEAGLFRLRGHKGEITDLGFLEVSTLISQDIDSTKNENISSRSTQLLISSSKDSFVKIWDLDVQHCIHTLTGHRDEVWSFDVMHRTGDNYALLVTGSNDKFLRTWKITTKLLAPAHSSAMELSSLFEREGVEFVGTLERPGGKKRVCKLRFDKSIAVSQGTLPGAIVESANVLVVHSLDKAVDMYIVRTNEDRQKRQKRRQKRFKEKMEKLEGAKNKQVEKEAPPPAYLPSDDLESAIPIRSENKIASFHFHPRSLITLDNIKNANILVATQDNLLQSWNIPMISLVASLNENEDTSQHKLNITHSIALPGHRNGIRNLVLSSDDSMLLSTAGNQIKLWNVISHNCIRTLELADSKSTNSGLDVQSEDDSAHDVILSSLFVPGNRHVLVGTKRGYLELYELASGQLLQREKAHEGKSIWTLDLRSDHKGFTSGGGQEVWDWDFEFYEVPLETNSHVTQIVKRLGFSQTRVLKLTDDVLCMKHSPDGKFLAVGLLDSTVRIFFQDSYRFYLSLYGHKFPVLCLDISSDSTIIATGSADKSVKIWGMDFGDCHKSLHAHENSVMKLQFIRGTHFFLTVSKDNLVKYWDADRFIDILHLKSHHAEVWSLAIASKGQFFFTSGNDKSIRQWNQTKEQVFPEEERQKRLDESFEANLKNANTSTSDDIGEVIGGLQKSAQDSVEAWKGVQSSKDSIEFGERIMQALDICEQEMENWKRFHELALARKHERQSLIERAKLGDEMAKAVLAQQNEETPKPLSHPLLQGKTPSQYILSVLRSVKLSDLNETLLTLPFDYVLMLLQHLSKILESGNEIELCVKCSLLLVQIHQNQIISTHSLTSSLAILRKHIQLRLSKYKDTIGFNMAALKYIHQDIQSAASANYFGEAKETSAITTSRKRKYNTVAHRHKSATKSLRRPRV